MNAISFWVRLAGWTAATLAEVPLQAACRLLDVCDDAHDVWEDEQ